MFDVTAYKGKGNEREKKAHTNEWFANMFGPSTYTHTHTCIQQTNKRSRAHKHAHHTIERSAQPQNVQMIQNYSTTQNDIRHAD